MVFNWSSGAGVLPKYFSSEWSVAKYHLPEGSQYIVAFGHQKNTVVILGMDGRHENKFLARLFPWIKFKTSLLYKIRVMFLSSMLLTCCATEMLCSFYRCQYDPSSGGGEMTQLEFHNFLQEATWYFVRLLIINSINFLTHLYNVIVFLLLLFKLATSVVYILIQPLCGKLAVGSMNERRLWEYKLLYMFSVNGFSWCWWTYWYSEINKYLEHLNSCCDHG